MKHLELHVALRHTPVWRRVHFPASGTFAELHERLQLAFGWESRHLFGFFDGTEMIAASRHYKPYKGKRVPTAAKTRVKKLLQAEGDTCEYVYDFGDGWTHEIRVEGSSNRYADIDEWLVGGAYAAPPEDCGGPPGYARLVPLARGEKKPSGPEESAFFLRFRNWHPDTFELPPQLRPRTDIEKVYEATLALLCRTLTGRNRAELGIDWMDLEALHQRGWIELPTSDTAKSVRVTDLGVWRAKEFQGRYFGKDEE